METERTHSHPLYGFTGHTNVLDQTYSHEQTVQQKESRESQENVDSGSHCLNKTWKVDVKADFMK